MIYHIYIYIIVYIYINIISNILYIIYYIYHPILDHGFSRDGTFPDIPFSTFDE